MKDSSPKKIKYFESGIINLNNSSGPGTHWTAYKKCGKNIYYIDSFGNLRTTLESKLYFNSNGVCNIFYNHTSYNHIIGKLWSSIFKIFVLSY